MKITRLGIQSGFASAWTGITPARNVVIPHVKFMCSDKPINHTRFPILHQYLSRAFFPAAALKWAYGILSNRGKLGEKFADIPQQAFPRESLLARPASLSETQVHNIKESFLEAVNVALKG